MISCNNRYRFDNHSAGNNHKAETGYCDDFMAAGSVIFIAIET